MLFKRTPSQWDKLTKLTRAHADAGTFSGTVLVAQGAQTVLCRTRHGQLWSIARTGAQTEHWLDQQNVYGVGLYAAQRGQAQLNIPIGALTPAYPLAIASLRIIFDRAGLPEHLVIDSADHWIHQPSTLMQQLAHRSTTMGTRHTLGLQQRHFGLVGGNDRAAGRCTFCRSHGPLAFKPAGFAHAVVNAVRPSSFGAKRLFA